MSHTISIFMWLGQYISRVYEYMLSIYGISVEYRPCSQVSHIRITTKELGWFLYLFYCSYWFYDKKQ